MWSSPISTRPREIQGRILGIETDITRWQQRQNDKNNFTATVPYDLEQLRGEAKEDCAIIDLYWARNPEAIAQTSEKYGNYCRTVARNILPDRRDADECVNDTWLNAWNAMPEDRPIISVDYTLDNDQDPSQATVSVKHRLNQVEGDSFSFLTMGLIRQNGNWYLDWSGIEK